MVSKPPNEDGVYEVRVELKGEAKKEEEATTPVVTTPKVNAPTYQAPSTSSVDCSQAAAHIRDVAEPYYKALLDLGLLTPGQK